MINIYNCNMEYENYLKKLISLCLENKLIETVDDIDGLIDIDGFNFTEGLAEIPQIETAIKWAFENDKLHDFYNEYWEEVFLNSELSKTILQGSIEHDNSMLDMSFTLRRINSKNKYYFKVEKSGYLANDIWDDDYFLTDQLIYWRKKALLKCSKINAMRSQQILMNLMKML